MTKFMGKTGIWTILCFYPRPHVNIVEKQQAKVSSSHVMGSQYCIGGEGEFYTHFLKFPWYLVTDCLKFTTWKGKWGPMHVVSKNTNVIYRAWLCYITLCHEYNDSKRFQNGAQISAIMFLSCYYLAVVRKGLLQARNDKCCSLVKLLCIYFYYFFLLNDG